MPTPIEDASLSQRPEGTYKPTSRLVIAAAWMVVSIPAAWGVSQTISTSIKLFQTPAKSIASPENLKAPAK